jgi:hypothetical protein
MSDTISELMARIEEEKEYNRKKAREHQATYRNKNKEKLRTDALEYRNNNKDMVNKQSRTIRRDLKDRAIEYLGGKCVDCSGVYHQAAYDFHHKDPSLKDYQISGKRVWEIVKQELDKCELLCSNCHRIRHYKD